MSKQKITMNDINQGLPAGAINETEITIGGDLFQELLTAADKMIEFSTANKDDREIVKEVVIRAIALLLRSDGREIIFRDKRTGTGETYTLWKLER